MKLNARQRKFVYAYAGNAAAAARAAGYLGSDAAIRVTASRVLANANVAAAIAARAQREAKATVADRQELQELWTTILRTESVELGNRMAAARDLAKSHGLFIERHRHELGETLEQLLGAALGSKP